MRRYLVGGAVRDRLLGLEPADRDYVVTDVTHAEMLARGFRRVGAAFDVFIDPLTREEHVVATGSIVDDLARRDLTVNSMATDEAGTLVDPFGGRADLEARVLRRTSDAFLDDPIRVLRTARLSARLGFSIDPETVSTAQRMAEEGRLDDMVGERVGLELRKALAMPRPSRFFEALETMGALGPAFPEVAALRGVPQPAAHHAEGCALTHTLLVVDEAAAAGGDLRVRYGALTHDLGKALTPAGELPRHFGHEERGVAPAGALGARLRLAADLAGFGTLAARHHGRVHVAREMGPAAYGRVFGDLPRGRQVAEARALAAVSAADHRGRAPRRDDYPQGPHFVRVVAAMAAARLADAYAGTEVAAMAPERRTDALVRLRAAAARRAIRSSR